MSKSEAETRSQLVDKQLAQVKRYRERFPSDFLFQLAQDEKADVVANCNHLQNLKFSKALPFAFTEHGAIQAANVLASSQAVEMGIYVVRAFVQLRQLLDARKRLSRRALRARTPAQRKLPVESRLGSGDFDPTSNKIKVMTMKVSWSFLWWRHPACGMCRGG